MKREEYISDEAKVFRFASGTISRKAAGRTYWEDEWVLFWNGIVYRA